MMLINEEKASQEVLKSSEYARYKDIINQTLHDYYPELKNKRIFHNIHIYETPTFYMGTATIGKNEFAIIQKISTDLFKEPAFEKIVTGGFAHELSHISRGHFEYKTALKIYLMKAIPLILEKYIEKKEKETDSDVVRRGLGNELCINKKYLENMISKFNSGRFNGFSSQEISDILAKQN